MKRIAIVGGGIAGLSAAFYLDEYRRGGVQLDYTLFESRSRPGGSIATEQLDGFVVEAGPDSFLTEKPWGAELCRELGIADQLIPSNDHARKTYIVVGGRLVPIPDGLMFMVPTKILPTVLSPLFSPATKLLMAAEWFHPPRPHTGDESVASLVERHYGAEMVERLADPLLAGVYGGRATELSVRAVMPQFVEMEQKHGSLGRAMLAARKRMKAVRVAPLFTSLKGGMQQIVDAIVTRLPQASTRTDTAVRWLRRDGERWLVATERNEVHAFDAVILATPAAAAGALLESMAAELASELREIAYSSSVTVALGYPRDGVQLPPGFGFLVPRSEGKRMLACTFVHNKFPHRAPAGHALLRVFLGGSGDEQILELADEDIAAIVCAELDQIMGLRAEPLFICVHRWKAAMAQYGVGHLERLDRIERLRSQLPGLALAGNGYRGIGVPDCIRSGKDAAAQLAAEGKTVTTSSVPVR